MGISTRVEFEVIKPKSMSNSYVALVHYHWGRNMTTNISLGEYIIKIKARGKKVIIHFDPREGKPWDDPDNRDVDVCRLY